MGILAEFGYILYAITRQSTSTEFGGTYVNGVGSMVYGSNTAFQVTCRRK